MTPDRWCVGSQPRTLFRIDVLRIQPSEALPHALNPEMEHVVTGEAVARFLELDRQLETSGSIVGHERCRQAGLEFLALKPIHAGPELMGVGVGLDTLAAARRGDLQAA